MSDEPVKPVVYPKLPEALHGRSLWGMLAFFGPGAVIASVTVGSGETVFASRGGAVFGYALLWCFVAGAVLKGVQVYSGARFMVLTGKHPLESWASLPGPKGWFVWLLAFMTIIWMPFWLGGGLPRMLGDFSNWIVGWTPEGIIADQGLNPSDPETKTTVAGILDVRARGWATLFIATGVTLTLLQTYGFLERLQTVLVAMLLLCMLVALAFTKADWIAALTGTVIPTAPRFEPWLVEKYPDAFKERLPWVEMVVYLGAVGGGTSDYFGYLGLLRAKGWGMLERVRDFAAPSPYAIDLSTENLERGRRWLKAPLADVSVSFLCVLIFTLCFVILGAAMLHPAQKVPSGLNLLTMQLDYLVRPDQAPALQWILSFIYKTGVFFAFLGTIFGAYELYTWTTRECLVAAMPGLRKVDIKHFRMGTLLYVGLGGLFILWSFDKNPVVVVTPAALVGSGLTCGLWCFAMLWSDAMHVPKPFRMNWVLRGLVVVAGIVLTVVPAIGIYKYVQTF